MALQKIVSSRPETPYSRPPAIHVSVVAVKDESRILSWIFEDGDARPVSSKTNKTAIISDGNSVAKLTLYEAFASKVDAGKAYIMKGYSLRGQYPPYGINITKETHFFKSAPVEVSAALKLEAEKLLSPSSQITALGDVMKTEGLITVEGEVVEISTIRKVNSGKDDVPLRTICLKEGKTQVQINLWREAVILEFELGAQTQLTHLKGSVLGYGYRLQSTHFTAIEETKATVILGAMGATEYEGRPGIMKLLVEGEIIYEIREELWLPLEKQLTKLPFYMSAVVTGKRILQAEAFVGEVEI